MEQGMGSKTCPECGGSSPAQANFCSHCGRALDAVIPQPSGNPKWYYNVWFTLIMLFAVLGPFGLPLVWKNPHFSRRAKTWLTVAMVFYTVFLVDLTVRAVRGVMDEVNRFNSTLQF